MRNDKFSRGYTIIEILVALTVATILFLTGFTAYREFSRRQILENSYKELRSNLGLARQLANSGEKPTGCTSSLDGYTVAMSASGYTISAACGVTINVRTITLSSGIVLSGPPSFTYKVIGEGTTLTGSTAISLTQSATGKVISATLSKEGILQR